MIHGRLSVLAGLPDVALLCLGVALIDGVQGPDLEFPEGRR